MIKEEYKNIPDNMFISISYFSGKDIDINNKYEINKLGEIRNKNTGKLLKHSYSNSYPSVILYGNTREKRKSIAVHILLANVFIVNDDPVNKIFVDHIDQQKDNLSLNNLRFVTPSENSRNWKRKSSYVNNKYKIESFDPTTKKIRLYRWEDFSKKSIQNVRSSIKLNKLYKNKYWKIINIEVENYYKRFTKDQLLSEKWIDLSTILKLTKGKFYISSLGVIKVNGLLTLGTKGAKNYKSISLEKNTFKVHRLVARAFLLNREFYPNEVVDHLTGNPEFNASSELSVGTQSDNMKNPITLKKINKTKLVNNDIEIGIKQYDLDGNLIAIHKNFLTIKKLYPGINIKGVKDCYNGKYISSQKFIWCKSGEIKSRLLSISENIREDRRIVEKYNLSGIFLSKTKVKDLSKEDKTGILSCCNEKQISANGFLWCFEGKEETIRKALKRLEKLHYKKKIKQYSLEGNFIKEFNNLDEAVIEIKRSRTNITNACNDGQLSAAGYLWCYSGEENKIQEKVKKIKPKEI